MRFQSNERNLPDRVYVSRAAGGFNTSMRLTPRVNLPSVSHMHIQSSSCIPWGPILCFSEARMSGLV